jgi:polysaccharide export outer membrane protein
MNKGILLAITAVAFILAGCESETMLQLPLQPKKTQVYEEVKVERQNPEQVKKELEALQHSKPEPYHIASNDSFDFKVYDNQELDAKSLVVTPDGYISITLIGPIKIGGLTIIEATNLIEKKLKKYIKFPKISLSPIRIQSSTFTIAGKVGNPGRYPIINNARLTDAIAIAKGFAVGEFQGDTVEMADLTNAYIVRKGRILPVNFTKAIREGDWLNNIPLRNGDYIYIPSSMNSSIYVLGEVHKPTYVGYKDNMTILQALAFAQGLKDTHSENAFVIRGGLVNPKVYKVNIDDIRVGEGYDFLLKPNDIIFFPKGGLSKYNVIVQKLLPTLEALNLLAGPFGNAGISINTSN